MGTGFKGVHTSYRSISDNIKTTASKYSYYNGRFGTNSPSTGNKTRNITSNDPVATANDFYSKIANGGSEKKYNNNFKITQMSDGTVITYRKTSTSDGTPVVEINISNSNNTGGVKQQKIHFIEGEE